jgi:DNA-binding transcriptional MerR regulator
MESSAREHRLFKIGVVTRVTGVPVATLRVWEKRYGFPKSARTAGGHRLYSERDIELIRWVKSQLDMGMKTSQAMRTLERLEQGDGLSAIVPTPAPTTVEAQPQGSLDTHVRHLLDTLTANDLEGADRLLGEMLAFYSPEQIVLGVILPVLSGIGTEWAEGRIGVATEHLASAFLRQRLLMWLVTGPTPRQVRPVVMACAPGEWHDGSLLMLAVLLRRRGWPVLYLGQSVPLGDLAAFVRQVEPSAVVLVAMTEEPARSIIEWPRYFAEAAAGGSVTVGYGGAVYGQQPALREETPGLFLGTTLEEGLASVEALLRRG